MKTYDDTHKQLGLLTACPPDRPTAAAPLAVLDDARQRGTTFHEVPVKAILNSPATTGMGFWSLNPYVGCEFGCTYCYARETHRWVMEKADGRSGGQADSGSVSQQRFDSEAETDAESLTARPPDRLPSWLAFEKQILVKTSAAAVLTRTLFPARLAGASLVIGTATDPYQPAERKFRLTRGILEALRGWKGLSLSIITKSPLILRDLDVLLELSQRHELSVNISIASVDAATLRKLEARSPAPHARMRALKGLTDAGIYAGVMMAPVIPGVTDSREQLAAVMAAGKEAGARYVVGGALRLGPAARARFLPQLAQEYPDLVGRYTSRFGQSQSPGADYIDALNRRIRLLQQEYGFPVTNGMSGRPDRKVLKPSRGVPDVAEQWSLL
ncbi:MAG: radical SAM protein [Gemmatimonadales bacterium]